MKIIYFGSKVNYFVQAQFRKMQFIMKSPFLIRPVFTGKPAQSVREKLKSSGVSISQSGLRRGRDKRCPFPQSLFPRNPWKYRHTLFRRETERL